MLHDRHAGDRRERARAIGIAPASPWTCPASGRVTGDVAWGGNWFFLIDDTQCALELAQPRPLTRCGRARSRLRWRRSGITGADGAEIDHIELFGPPGAPGADSRNFVLCPGGAYDRSPCGTGTSAKLACLAADGKLAAGADWVQESIIGSRFTGALPARPRRRDHPQHHRPRLRDRRGDAAPRPRRSIRRRDHRLTISARQVRGTAAPRAGRAGHSRG